MAGYEKEKFNEWFNSLYYHILYKHRDEKEAEAFIDKLCSHLSIKSGDRVLDLPCGKGRHSVYLSKKGAHVTGADLSSENIRYASAHAHDSLHFVLHDIREILLPGTFDYVLNLFTSFGYFESEDENVQAMCALTASLKDTGTLVVDFLNTEKVITELVPDEVKIVDGVHFHIRRKLENGFIIKEVDIKDGDQQFYFSERVKAITKEGFERYFHLAKLKLIGIFGDYSLGKYKPERSERMIFILKKIDK